MNYVLIDPSKTHKKIHKKFGSLYAFGKHAHIYHNSIYRIIKQDGKMRKDTALRFSKAMGENINSIFLLK